MSLQSQEEQEKENSPYYGLVKPEIIVAKDMGVATPHWFNKKTGFPGDDDSFILGVRTFAMRKRMNIRDAIISLYIIMSLNNNVHAGY